MKKAILIALLLLTMPLVSAVSLHPVGDVGDYCWKFNRGAKVYVGETMERVPNFRYCGMLPPFETYVVIDKRNDEMWLITDQLMAYWIFEYYQEGKEWNQKLMSRSMLQ
jgi:hypothetical protein